MVILLIHSSQVKDHKEVVGLFQNEISNGQVGTRNLAAYVAARHGVVGLSQTAALEYADKNIRVNAVGPGYINTPLRNTLQQEAVNALTGLYPMGRLGNPEEVAELVLWLSSPKASFVTGSYYPIDGGYLAQ